MRESSDPPITFITENQLDLSQYKRVKILYAYGLFAIVGVLDGEVDTDPISLWMTRAQATAMFERLTARIEAGELKPKCDGQFENPRVLHPGYFTEDRDALLIELHNEQLANLQRDGIKLPTP